MINPETRVDLVHLLAGFIIFLGITKLPQVDGIFTQYPWVAAIIGVLLFINARKITNG